VTRGHRHDEVSLRNVVGRGAAYVGMIGSRRRARAVLQHLREDGADPAAVAEVRTPIGLDIGAETPEEIAVAIMAEIIQARRGRGTGRPLSEDERA
jgi:xanthine dehydrogenase accessory factor